MPMSESDIFFTVKRVLAEVTHDASVIDLGPEAQLRDELGIDSMTSLTFLMALEDAIDGFVVDPATLEAEHFETIGSICRYVALQLAPEMVG
jgi:acyl carrier protein